MRKTFHYWLRGGLVAAALAMTGCTGSRYDRSLGELTDDKSLTHRVKSALADQPVYKYPDVKVQTFRGVVQLSGFVAAHEQRDAATEIAQHVRGVNQVQNDILVAPLSQGVADDFIPGRAEVTNRVGSAAGRPGATTNVTTGAGRQLRNR